MRWAASRGHGLEFFKLDYKYLLIYGSEPGLADSGFTAGFQQMINEVNHVAF